MNTFNIWGYKKKFFFVGNYLVRKKSYSVWCEKKQTSLKNLEQEIKKNIKLKGFVIKCTQTLANKIQEKKDEWKQCAKEAQKKET